MSHGEAFMNQFSKDFYIESEGMLIEYEQKIIY